MYNFFKFIFLGTLTLFVLTLIFASYVGVYLTYFAIPVIVVSGLLTYFLEPEITKSVEVYSPQKRLEEIEKRLKELE
jgi:antibiotic biosynthesis monooxygenase (ABM) superfamily enzyme